MRRADDSAATDAFAQSTLNTLVGNLQQEIAQGSTAATVSGGATVYQPLSPLYMLPARSGNPAPSGTPAADPIPNLIRRSVRSDAIAAPGVSSLASAVSSSDDASLNGSAVNPARWNLHYLIPRFDAGANSVSDPTPDTAANFTTPDWVLVTRNGPAVENGIGTGSGAVNNSDPANTNYVVGRYAFAMYDEGGLLDVNAAGHPTPATPAAPMGFTPTQAGWKGLLPLADLTQLPVVKQPASAPDYLPQASIDNLVGWRNYASARPAGTFPNYTFDAAAGTRWYNAVLANRNGFLAVDPTVQFNGQTDQRFTSRQQLIGLCDALGISRNALQYLTTFSRALEQPSFVPAHLQYPSTAPSINAVASTAPPAVTGADGYLGNNDAAGSTNSVANQDLANPAFLSVRVQTAFTRQDGSTAVVGEPLVKRKFALSRLGEMSYSATDSTPSLTDPNATQNHIKDWFGLSRTSASAPWTYNHGNASIMTLSQVAATGREPDFAELLKAAINVGSLAKGGPNLSAYNSADYQYTLDTSVDFNVLQIMANLIDQYDTDSFPTVIQIAAGNTFHTVRGVEDLPYLYRYHPFSVVTRLPSPLLGNSQSVSFTVGYQSTRSISHCEPVENASGGLVDGGNAVSLYIPEVWNPHDANAPASTTGARPARFRITAVTDDPLGQTPVWQAGMEPLPNTTWYNYIPPAAAIPATTRGLTDPATSNTDLTAYTFSDDSGKLFREPTLLWRADAPTNANLQADPGSLAGPYTDVNTGNKYYGIHFGQSAVSYVGSVSHTAYPASPQSASDTYIFQAANAQTINVQPVGSALQYTYRLQYQDPANPSNWVTYDEKYPDIHGLSQSTLIVNKADFTNNQWEDPLPNRTAQLSDTATAYDPRTARFGVGTSVQFADNVMPLEATAAANYAANTSASNLAVENSKFTVFVTERPFADLGNRVNYSNPCMTSNPGKNAPMRWFSGAGYSVSNGVSNAPVEWDATLFGQNDPSIRVPNRTSPTSTDQRLYYEDADGVARRAMGADSYSYGASGLPAVGSAAAQTNLTGLPLATADSYTDNGPSSGKYGVGTPLAQSQSRPFILNHPFHSVGEMSYAFTGTPWKQLDFFNPESGDGALLDTFCLTEPPTAALVGGKVNLNTRQAPVLQAVLAGAYRDTTNDFSTPPTYALPALTSAEAANAASKLTSITTDTTDSWRGPLIDPADMVGHYVANAGTASSASDLYQFNETVTNTTYAYAGLSAALDGTVYTASPILTARIQRMREAAIRPLADCGQTRVWNILIDLVAQTGNYPASATTLSQFQVAQETHYWLHVALDRFTGQVLDENIEQVYEGLTNLSLSAASVPEGQPAGTTVGTIQPTGANPGDTFTYSLVPGDGATDNAAFAVSGNTLQTAAVFNYLAQSSYGVRLRAVNEYGQIFEKALTITVSPSAYTQWKINNFGNAANNPAVAGDQADPDQDGLSNLMEYALGLPPMQAGASGISSTVANGVLTIYYTRSSTATDVGLHAYWQKNLPDPPNWTRTGVTETMLSDDGVIQHWQATLPVDPANRHAFLELRGHFAALSQTNVPAIQKVIVLGGGSAGLIAALTLKRTFRALGVTVIRSPEIGIIGVGEGTTPAFGEHLFGPLGLSVKEFHEKVRPTWKLGLRFLWGPREEFHFTFLPMLANRPPDLRRNHAYYCETDFSDANLQSALMRRNKAFPAGPDGKPRIDFDPIAYHMENVSLVAYLEWRAKEDGVAFVDATVDRVDHEGDRITSLQLTSGERLEADFFVDASGFRALLIGETLREPFVSYKDVLFCDRAVIGPRDRERDEPIRPYTTVETMEAGWCWRIDHEHHVNRGYVYSSDFLSDADAEKEFRAQNPAVDKTRLVRFRSGRYERAWVGNVVAVGNASGFVEPLEATALGNLCTECRNMAVVLHETALDPTPTAVGVYNAINGKEWDDIRDFLAVHYKFNTLKDNAFWQKCRADIPLRSAQPLLDFYRENGPSWLANNTIFVGLHQFGLESYYTMFLGMKLPHGKPHPATPEERAKWESHKAAWVRQARDGITVKEGLELLRNPQAVWKLPRRTA